jgi:sulfur-oxidizing protein SoxY
MPPDLLLSRRRILVVAAAGAAAGLWTGPAAADPEMMEAAVRAFTEGRPVRPGRVTLDAPPLVENGNSVALSVAVESPMTAEDHVRTVALFNQKNPQPDIARFHFSAQSGRCAAATRIRLADSQTLLAIAEMSDGTLWSGSADVIVTLAACLEG